MRISTKEFNESHLAIVTDARLSLACGITMYIDSHGIAINGVESITEFVKMFDQYMRNGHADAAVHIAHEIAMLHKDLPHHGYIDASHIMPNSKLASKVLGSKLYTVHPYIVLDASAPITVLRLDKHGFNIQGNARISSFVDLFDIYHSFDSLEECAIKGAKAIVNLQQEKYNELADSVEEDCDRIAADLSQPYPFDTGFDNPIKFSSDGLDRLIKAILGNNRTPMIVLPNKDAAMLFAGQHVEPKTLAVDIETWALNHKFSLDMVDESNMFMFPDEMTAKEFSHLLVEPDLDKQMAAAHDCQPNNCNDQGCPNHYASDEEGEPETLVDPRDNNVFDSHGFVLSMQQPGGEFKEVGNVLGLKVKVKSNEPDELPASMAATRDDTFYSHKMYHSIIDELQVADDRKRVDDQEIARLNELLQRSNHRLREMGDTVADQRIKLEQERNIVDSMTKAKERSPCNWKTTMMHDGSPLTQAKFENMTVELSRARKASHKAGNCIRDLDTAKKELVEAKEICRQHSDTILDLRSSRSSSVELAGYRGEISGLRKRLSDSATKNLELESKITKAIPQIDSAQVIHKHDVDTIELKETHIKRLCNNIDKLNERIRELECVDVNRVIQIERIDGFLINEQRVRKECQVKFDEAFKNYKVKADEVRQLKVELAKVENADKLDLYDKLAASGSSIERLQNELVVSKNNRDSDVIKVKNHADKHVAKLDAEIIDKNNEIGRLTVTGKHYKRKYSFVCDMINALEIQLANLQAK